MKKVGSIYAIRNIDNGKVYIGQTSIKNPMKRWAQHYDASKDETNQLYLYRAIRKHGIEKFCFQIIETKIPIEELDEKEQYYIDLYHSRDYSFGYNLTNGGQINKESILKESEVLEIIEMIRNGKSFREISLRFCISASSISDINCGDTWYFDGIDYPIRKSRNRKKNFSKEEILDICFLLKKNISFQEIADLYDTSITTISKINKGVIYKKKGITYPISNRNTFKHLEIDEIKRIIWYLENTDMIHKEIARCVCVTRSSVKNINNGTYHKNDLKQLGYENFPIRKKP